MLLALGELDWERMPSQKYLTVTAQIQTKINTFLYESMENIRQYFIISFSVLRKKNKQKLYLVYIERKIIHYGVIHDLLLFHVVIFKF